MKYTAGPNEHCALCGEIECICKTYGELEKENIGFIKGNDIWKIMMIGLKPVKLNMTSVVDMAEQKVRKT